MNPVKVIFQKNGAIYTCYTENQLESFLSSGWIIAPDDKPKKKTKKAESGK